MAGEEKRFSENILYLVPISVLIAGFLIAGAVYMGGKKNGTTGSATSERADSQNTDTSADPAVAGAQKVNVSVDDDPSWGLEDAPVTIIEFSEYQCPYCKRYVDEAYAQIKEEYGDQVRYVFRDFPLPFHNNAMSASVTANCAGAQDKYFEMHDLLFDNQEVWSVATDPSSEFAMYAEEIGLDEVVFSSCVADETGSIAKEIEKDIADGTAAGVNGTPAFFINGTLLVGAQPFSEFKKIIDAELAI